MLTPSLPYVGRLLGKTAEQHAKWLVRGLRDYLFGTEEMEPRNGDSFPGAAAFIGDSGSVIEDLARVINVFPDDDLDTIRGACARAISKLDLDAERDIEVAEHIIALAVQIKAYEILDALKRLPSQVLLPTGMDRLFAKALSAMYTLAEPGDKEVVAYVRDLVEAWKPFPAEQSGLALRVMTRAWPRRLLDHLRFLYRPMELYYGRGALDDHVERRRRYIIGDIADIVFSSDILARTVERGVRCPDDPVAWQHDWWANTFNTSTDPKIAALRDRLGLPHPGISQLGQMALQADCDWASETGEQEDDYIDHSMVVVVVEDETMSISFRDELLRLQERLAYEPASDF